MALLNGFDVEIKFSQRIFSLNDALCFHRGRIGRVFNELIPRNESQLCATFWKFGDGR